MSNEEKPLVMPSVNGRPFRCSCGGNVFREGPRYHYQCTACEALYKGEPLKVFNSTDMPPAAQE